MSGPVLLAGLAGMVGAVGAVELAAAAAERMRSRTGRPPRRLRPLGLAVLRRLGREVGTRPAAARDLPARLQAAGVDLPAADLLAIKAGAALVALLVCLPLAPGLPGRLGLLFPVAVPGVAFLLPDAWLRRRIRDRARVMDAELPDVLDLVRVAVAAGLPAIRALAEVGARHPGLLAAELRRAAARAELGVPSEQAYAELARRAPVPGAAVLVGALGRAARHGAPLSETLSAQAAEARSAQARAAAERAARAAPKIQLVIALLLVPAVVLLVAAALVPALLD